MAKAFSVLDPKFKVFMDAAPDAIVIVRSTGEIVVVNSLAEELFGYSNTEMVGLSVDALVPEHFQGAHVTHRNNYYRDPKTRPMGAGRSLVGRKRDGGEIPIEISLSPLETEEGIFITSIIRDITDRRRVQEQLQASLREKESLLKEIHHRVKNNLQITSSLLKLQSEHIHDPSTQQMFVDSQSRIRSMALVHEKLYQTTDLSRINFQEYVKSLADLIFTSLGMNRNKIKFTISEQLVHLSVETAIPCGLIINELLSNCVKHSFLGNRTGTITVNICRKNEVIEIVVADDGIGLPQNFDINRSETLGLQLVRTLVDQLQGKLNVSNQAGAHFAIRFSETANG